MPISSDLNIPARKSIYRMPQAEMKTAQQSARLLEVLEGIEKRVNFLVHDRSNYLIINKLHIDDEVFRLEKKLIEKGLPIEKIEQVVDKYLSDSTEYIESFSFDPKEITAHAQLTAKEIEGWIGKLFQDLETEIDHLNDGPERKDLENVLKELRIALKGQVDVQTLEEEIRNEIENRLNSESHIFEKESVSHKIGRILHEIGKRIECWLIDRVAGSLVYHELSRNWEVPEHFESEDMASFWNGVVANEHSKIYEKVKKHPILSRVNSDLISEEHFGHILDFQIKHKLSEQLSAGQVKEIENIRTLIEAEDLLHQYSLMDDTAQIENYAVFGKAASLLLEEIPAIEMPLQQLARIEVNEENRSLMKGVWHRVFQELYLVGELYDLSLDAANEAVDRQMLFAEKYLEARHLVPQGLEKGLHLNRSVETEISSKEIEAFFYHRLVGIDRGVTLSTQVSACTQELLLPLVDLQVKKMLKSAKEIMSVQEPLANSNDPMIVEIVDALGRELDHLHAQGEISKRTRRWFTSERLADLLQSRLKKSVMEEFQVSSDFVEQLKGEVHAREIHKAFHALVEVRRQKVPQLKLTAWHLSREVLEREYQKNVQRIESEEEDLRTDVLRTRERRKAKADIADWKKENARIKKMLADWDNRFEIDPDLKITIFSSKKEISELSGAELEAWNDDLEDFSVRKGRKELKMLDQLLKQPIRSENLEPYDKVKGKKAKGLLKDLKRLSSELDRLEQAIWTDRTSTQEIKVPSHSRPVSEVDQALVKKIIERNKKRIEKLREDKSKKSQKTIEKRTKENAFLSELLERWDERDEVCEKHQQDSIEIRPRKVPANALTTFDEKALKSSRQKCLQGVAQTKKKLGRVMEMRAAELSQKIAAKMYLSERIVELPSMPIDLFRASKQTVQSIFEDLVDDEDFGETYQVLKELLANWDERDRFADREALQDVWTLAVDRSIASLLPEEVEGLKERIQTNADLVETNKKFIEKYKAQKNMVEKVKKAKKLMKKQKMKIKQFQSLLKKIEAFKSDEGPNIMDRLDQDHQDYLVDQIQRAIDEHIDASLDLSYLVGIPVTLETKDQVVALWKEVTSQLFEKGQLAEAVGWMHDTEGRKRIPYAKKYLAAKAAIADLKGLPAESKEELATHLRSLEQGMDSGVIEKLVDRPVETQSTRKEGLTAQEKEGFQVLSKGLRQLKDKKVATLSANEKETIAVFLADAKNNQKLNAKISELLEEDKMLYGISKESLNFVRAFSYKSRYMTDFVPLTKKLQQTWSRAATGVAAIKPEEKLSLHEWGVLYKLKSLGEGFEKMEKMGIVPEDIFAEGKGFSQEVHEALSAYQNLKDILVQIENKMQEQSNYRSGDVMIQRFDRILKRRAAPTTFSDIKQLIVVGKYEHAAKIFRAGDLGETDETRLSHIGQDKHIDTRLEFDELLLYEGYRLNISKLIDPPLHEAMKAKYGTDWQGHVQRLYETVEATLHGVDQEKFSKLANTYERQRNAFVSKLKVFGHERKKTRDFQGLYDKFLKDENTVEQEMFCIEFAVKTTIIALVELENKLKEELGEAHVLNLPFTGKEKLKYILPGDLAAILQKSDAVEKVEPPEIVQELVRF